MRIVTHNGHFHADEVMGIASILQVYPEVEIIRTRDDSIIEEGDVVIDVGQVYDPVKRRFDHHQPAGAGKHEGYDIPYASFGLVWKEFGEMIAGGKDEAKVIETKLVLPIDAVDNGIIIATPVFEGIETYSLGDYIDSFAEGMESLEELDKAFMTALSSAKGILEREVSRAKRTVQDWRAVEEVYNASENKKIIILPKTFHWKRVLIPKEALFVIVPRTDGKWMSRAIPKAVNGFEVKKPFPASWSGLRDETLASVSGVEDAVFCHRDRYMCVAKTQEGAIKLAEIALNA